MDPDDTLCTAEQAVSDCCILFARELLDDYAKWRAVGGFEPATVGQSGKRGDEFERELLRKLGDLEMQAAAGYERFLAEFPQTVKGFGTGGGCTAWFIEKGRRGRYIYVTDDNLSEPHRTDCFLSVGAYEGDGPDEGQALEEFNATGCNAEGLLTWDEAIAWVRDTLAKL